MPAIYQHKKGGLYRHVGDLTAISQVERTRAELIWTARHSETTEPVLLYLVDGQLRHGYDGAVALTAYQDVHEPGRVWVRPTPMFYDGRFRDVTDLHADLALVDWRHELPSSAPLPL